MRHSTISVLKTFVTTIAGLAASTMLLHAETITQSSDYIAVAFEAEEYDDRGLRWVHTEAGTPQQEEDPDGNHSSSASGTEYLEVLPDYRVTHEDEFHPSGSLWGAGSGPELTYTLDFPEAGRYYVHLRAYSTGTEDNGAHVGINNNFPVAGRRVQWCGGKNRWVWSSAQRDSGGNGSCGREKTVYLEVPSAGTHTIHVQAREDGFELDRVVMIKDLSNNTRVCEPSGATEISCRDGFIESADGMIDLQVQLESDIPEAAIGDAVFFTAIVENLDPFDHATNLVTTLDLGAGFDYVGGPSECSHSGGIVTCQLADLEPTAPGESHDFIFQATVTGTGPLETTVSVTADEIERAPFNDTASLIIDGVTELPDVDLVLGVSAASQSLEVGDRTQINIQLENVSSDAANGVQLIYTLPDGVELVAVPSQCIHAEPVVCNLGLFAGDNVQTSIIDIEATEPGLHLHTVSLSSNNDPDTSNNQASTAVVVTVPDTSEEVSNGEEGDSDDGDANGGDATDNDTTDDTDQMEIVVTDDPDETESETTDSNTDNADETESETIDGNTNDAEAGESTDSDATTLDPSIDGNPAESGQASAATGGGGSLNWWVLAFMLLVRTGRRCRENTPGRVRTG